MGISFPSNAIGNVYTSAPVTNTKRGYWGSGAHSIDEDYDFQAPRTWSYRAPIYHGDRVTPGPYYRAGARVLVDRPVMRNLSGSDGNGSYTDTRTEFMSAFLPNGIFTDVIDKFNSNAANLKSEVTVKVLNKLREHKTGWGVNVLTASRTAGGMAAPLITILSEYKRIRHLQFSRLLSGKTLSELWLQYIYGVKPLMADIHGGMQILNSQLRLEGHAFRVSASGTLDDTYSNTDNSGTFSNEYSLNCRIKAGISATTNSAFISSLDEFGVINPAEVAWDLVPWSFVVDWCVPVGNVLQSLSASLGLDFHSGYITSVSSITKTSSKLDALDPGWSLLSSGELQVGYKEIIRSVWFDFPEPQLYYNNPFSTTHVANALALLRQLL